MCDQGLLEVRRDLRYVVRMFDILVEDTLLVVVIGIHKEMVVLQIHVVIHEI